MAYYRYVAVTKNGDKVEGKREASTKEQLLNYLLGKGLTVITIREDFGMSLKRLTSKELGGIPIAEKVLIAKQLSTMISAGIPIIQAVGIIRDQAAREDVKSKFTEVYKKIESGTSLSKALTDVKGIFSEIQANLIAAGEKSGNLNDMLIKVADDMDKSKKLRGKIVGAMIYPAIIFFVLILIMFIMVVFMIPQVESLYQSLQAGSELPWITSLLVQVSRFASSPLFLVTAIILVISTYVVYRYYNSDPVRRAVIDGLKLKIPVFGTLMEKVELTEFCRITSMLISSGIPIIEAIGTVSDAMGNVIFQNILIKAREEVTRGSSFSLALAKHNESEAFPSILIRIISTGEESGNMDKVLNDMYKYYNDEVDQITSNLTKLLEPFILVVVGFMVAFLAIAIYLPIYNVANLI